MRLFYFGVWTGSDAGHYLYKPSGHLAARDEHRALPFGWHLLDGALLPQNGPEIEGVIHRSVINGWTVLTFWDRSGDQRGRS